MINDIAIQSQWAEFEAYFMAGNPPLILQLLVLNLLFLLYMLVRRIRKNPTIKAKATNLQHWVVGINLLLVFQSDLFSLSWKQKN